MICVLPEPGDPAIKRCWVSLEKGRRLPPQKAMPGASPFLISVWRSLVKNLSAFPPGMTSVPRTTLPWLAKAAEPKGLRYISHRGNPFKRMANKLLKKASCWSACVTTVVGKTNGPQKGAEKKALEPRAHTHKRQ